MGNVLEGIFSIKDVMQMTYQSKFKNRYDNKERDVLKSITINTVKKFNVDRLDSVEVKYLATTSSYPQYKPYINVKGKHSKTQRKIKHSYDIIFETTELSLTNTKWKLRVGSQKIPRKAPQSEINSIYRENLKLWSKQRIKQHRASKKKYLNSGDWMAQVLGVNGDFLYRQEFVFAFNNHLFGRNRATYPPDITNPMKIMFFGKHELRFFEVLMQKGILTL